MLKHVLPSECSGSCTGCGACAAACSQRCISMQPDAEGFPNPAIHTASCKECSACRRVCPVSQPQQFPPMAVWGNVPLQVLAAWHLDKGVRRSSSSGGVFTALSEGVLAQGGAVVGAAFDSRFAVRHVMVEDLEGLRQLRGSKYVQSEVAPDLLRCIKAQLEQGRLLLFSGTPCQVAGLRSFLGKRYDNLLCCDLVCHGVPSPLLWARYLQYAQGKFGQLVGMAQRDKAKGWKSFGVRLELQGGATRRLAMMEDPYMSAFLRNYSLRRSCYACRFTSTTRAGDITLADFWGVGKKYPEFDPDDGGTSLLLVCSETGRKWLDASAARLFVGVADLDTAVAGNHILARPSDLPLERETFYRELVVGDFEGLVNRFSLKGPSALRRVVRAVKRRLSCFIR